MAKVPDGWRCINCKVAARGGAIVHAHTCPDFRSQWRTAPGKDPTEREAHKQAAVEAAQRFERFVSLLTMFRNNRYECPRCADRRHGGLKVDPGDDGSVLFHCFGCCTGDKDADREIKAEILQAMGLGWADAKGPGEGRAFSEWLEGLPDVEFDATTGTTPVVEEGAGTAPAPSRQVDLGPWLDGSYSPPQPSVGALRDDGVRLLYPGRWHNCDGLTEAGKSWAAIAHARDEMLNAERSVAYVHFEEELPGGTVSRLLSIGLPADVIRKRFVWLSNDRPWTAAEMAAELSTVDSLGLLVLDGKNAACDQHGKDPALTETVGWFRRTFVTPGARAGAAVLSLGHPVKAKDRRDERHGYGSTAWLDYLDGAAFRLEPSRDHPIRRGASGTASLYVVKDRYGEVSRRCAPDGREGWRYAGSLVVDDSGVSDGTSIRISAPAQDDPASGRAPDVIDKLAEEIVTALAEVEGRRYSSNRGLLELLRAQGVKFDDRDLAPALIRLETAGRLERSPVAGSRPRPGWLTAVNQDQEEE